MPSKDTMVDTVNLQSKDPTAAATTQATADAASAAKFQAQATSPAATPATPSAPGAPELIGGKFKSQDDLLAAYKSLEAKLGAPKAETPVTPVVAPEPPVKAPEALSIDPAAAAANAGFKMADLASEYSQNGDLTPATYAKLATAGIGKDMVDAFVAGQRVIYEAETAQVMAKAGVDKDTFSAMVTWAQANVAPADLQAYNQAVAGSPAMKQFALEAMHTRFIRAQGQDPKLFTGQRGVSTSGDVFRSTEQMLAAMRDPLYSKDPAFRADVAAKVARSKLS